MNFLNHVLIFNNRKLELVSFDYESDYKINMFAYDTLVCPIFACAISFVFTTP